MVGAGLRMRISLTPMFPGGPPGAGQSPAPGAAPLLAHCAGSFFFRPPGREARGRGSWGRGRPAGQEVGRAGVPPTPRLGPHGMEAELAPA